jgi:hypothetical protein
VYALVGFVVDFGLQNVCFISFSPSSETVKIPFSFDTKDSNAYDKGGFLIL